MAEMTNLLVQVSRRCGVLGKLSHERRNGRLLDDGSGTEEAIFGCVLLTPISNDGIPIYTVSAP